MPLVFGVLALILIVGFALVLAGRLPAVPQPSRDRYTARLPQSPGPADIDQLRLPVAFRGYRMDDVDVALGVLRDRIASLEAQMVAPAIDPGTTPAPPGPETGPAVAQPSPFAPPEPEDG
jgi:DivIVA domain-containing protein